MECTQYMEMVAVITSPSTSIKINKYQTEFSLVKIKLLSCRDRNETQKTFRFVPGVPLASPP